jgi:hypothetical protein
MATKRRIEMTAFLFSYRMPNGYVPGRIDVMATWKSWFEGMGEDLVEMGNPTFESRALGNTGSDTSLGGYSIVDANDLESALALAKGCPALADGGGVEVGVIAEVGGVTD